MRNFAKVVCMMLVLLSLAVTATASVSSTVIQTRPITFHAERGIFLSAEIINPGTDYQILKVVLPDSTILYRDLSNNEVWKEQRTDGQSLTSSTLTEEELNLLSGLDLDTGWFPPSFPIQIRLFFKASLGKIVADLPGDVQLRYDDSEVQPGEQLSTWLKWVGDQGGGNLHMEGGLEFGAMWKVVVNLPWPLPDINDSGDIPGVSQDLGFFRNCGFTPFLLNGMLSCSDPIGPIDFLVPIPIPPPPSPPILWLKIGASIGGTASGELSGNTICGDSYCVSSEGQEKFFPVSISSCQTTVGVTNSYDSDFNLDWGLTIRPKGCLKVIVIPWELCFDPYTKHFHIYNQNVPLNFNRPYVEFQINGEEPPPPSWCDATDDKCGYIQVCWENVSGEDGYRVYRDGSQIGSPGANQTCYTDSITGTHSYKVKAYNSCGNSGYSPSDNGTGLTPPPPPSWCSATDDKCNYIEVCWENVSGEDGYRVYRDGSYIGSTGANQTCYTDDTTGTHSYCVKAYNSCGQSNCSPSDNGTGLTTPSPPPAPTVVAGCNYIDVSWSTMSGATQYCIYRDGLHINCIGGTSWRDNDPDTSQRCYQISAANGCGEGDRSGEACSKALWEIENPPDLHCRVDGTIAVLNIEVKESYDIPLWYMIYLEGIQYDSVLATGTPSNHYATTYTDIMPLDSAHRYTVAARNTCGLTGQSEECLVTDVEDIPRSSLPHEFSLSQNYPNPFNMETRIEFALPRASHVTMDVYNVLGNRVKRIVDERLSAGFKLVTWDGRDESGNPVSSGIYFYRMVAGDFAETKKLVLLK